MPGLFAPFLLLVLPCRNSLFPFPSVKPHLFWKSSARYFSKKHILFLKLFRILITVILSFSHFCYIVVFAINIRLFLIYKIYAQRWPRLSDPVYSSLERPGRGTSSINLPGDICIRKVIGNKGLRAKGHSWEITISTLVLS